MTSNKPRPLSIGILFAGPVNDGGFMQAGHAALLSAAAETAAVYRFIERVEPRFELLRDALETLASENHDLIIAHGGQNNEAALAAAARSPNKLFAVTQGQVTAPNVASYDVLQEQSAFLAGMLAALTTRTGVVAHLSGIRVRPGLKGRAAYADGVRHADQGVRLVTCFCGHQDKPEVAEAAARRLIEAGADRLFTMLNSGRSGAITACRDLGCQQIGNVDDWTLREPDVFIGSAMADVGWGVAQAIRDYVNRCFPAGSIRHVGVEQPSTVRLSIRPDTHVDVASRISSATHLLASGELAPAVEYQGPEFAL